MEYITVGRTYERGKPKPFSYGVINGVQQVYKDSESAREALQKEVKRVLKYEVDFYDYDMTSYHSDTADRPNTGGYWYAEITIVRNDDDRDDDRDDDDDYRSDDDNDD